MKSLELGQKVIILKGEHKGTLAKVTGFSCGGCKLVNAKTFDKIWNGNMSSFDESWLTSVDVAGGSMCYNESYEIISVHRPFSQTDVKEKS